MIFKKEKELTTGNTWVYECEPVQREINSVKVKIQEIKSLKTYSVYAERWMYDNWVYEWSIWLVRHNIPTFKEAKIVAEGYMNRVLDYKL